jgi:hypothetical protein
MTELGTKISEFHTDNRRRIWTAAGCLVTGAIALYVGLWFILVAEPRMAGGGNEGPVPGGLVGIGIAGLAFAVILTVLAIRRRGESFDLYAEGLVHIVAGRETVLRWDDISAVRVVDAQAPENLHRRNQWLGRMLGGDLVCVLKLRTGGRLRFNGFTADARSLADWVRAAVEDGTTPRRP